MLVLNAYGGGYHAWDVPKSEFLDFQKVDYPLEIPYQVLTSIRVKASYAITLIYVPMVFIVKLALLSVMLRIFAPDPHKVLIIYTSVVVLLLYYIPALFIKIFFCHPISAYWEGTSNGGTCIDQQKVIIADSAISIASDLWILILPVPMLWSLHMSRVKKLRVIGILGAGGLATGFSIWRLVIMVEEAKTADITWFWIHCVLTANAEAGIGLICACLPTLSSYVVSMKNKSTNATNGSYQRSHELNSWNKLSSSKKNGNHSSSFPPTQTDQACLISTVEGAEQREGSMTSLQESNHPERPVIHKDVSVSQSYEFVK
ncbi:hypothetical protein EYZ11_008843 [Aspergillus tanneri]|uniref:Rhodopsin domain-containing protein n=1 Tax=Aspergillus tanneri TaxID=1220188 RepID=A0A4S3JBL4_9EURO|nr:hypothetical protein EYZ11_008843 [Aspergillus tanneri]